MADRKHRIGLHNICISGGGPPSKPGSTTVNSLMASFTFSETILGLFPYINSVAEQSCYYQHPPLLRFLFNQQQCVLYPDRCIATPFSERTGAGRFVGEFLDFINDIASQKKTIPPRSKPLRRVSVVEIIKLLPLKNCGECGYKTCMAFAAAISRQRTTPGSCPYFSSPIEEQAAYPVYDSNGKLLKTVLLDIDTTKISEALRRARRDLKNLDERIGKHINLRKDAESRANEALPTPLTDRETEVLRKVAGGETNNEIGKNLHISPHTVKSHIISIFNKLGVNDRTQASVWAARHNLL